MLIKSISCILFPACLYRNGRRLLASIAVFAKVKNMNKQDLVEFVHGKMGGTKVAAEEIVNGLIDSIIATLKKGGEVSIAGLGIFSVKPRAARMARNPKTGEQVKVAATRVPKFRAAKALKDAVK